MKPTLLIALLLTSFCQSFSQNKPALPITVHLTIDSVFEKNHAKEFYEKYRHDYSYTINTDSVTQKYYTVSVEIRNTAGKPVNIWMMSCSWNDNFMVNNNYMFKEGHTCLKNTPQLIHISVGETKKYSLTLMKSIRFDYPCTNCVLGKQVEETKIGLIIIDDIFKPTLHMWDYLITMEDKSKWQVVWSDSLYLLAKHADEK